MKDAYNTEELSIVREYFSHNIRTSTAMVVATVMVFKCGLGDDMENMSDVISESAYFLDVYDKGMEILFDFVLGVPVSADKEEIEPSRLISHFTTKVPITIAEQGISLSVDTDSFKFKSNGHIVKNLLEIILCEEARKSRGSVKITGRNGVYVIEKENPGENPAIFAIFVRLFGKLGIDFSYGEKRLELRFGQ